MTLSAHLLLPYSGTIFRLIQLRWPGGRQPNCRQRGKTGWILIQPHFSDSVDAAAQGMKDWMPAVDDVGRDGKYGTSGLYCLEFESA